ncbi:hypothetical protein D3C71_2116480 [compost metagenome]
MADALVASDPLTLIPEQVMGHQKKYESPAMEDVAFQFPGLEVSLRMRVSH